MSRGLYRKFKVLYYQGHTPSTADFFVLRLDTDEHARVAALSYAESVEEENPILAEELREKIAGYE